MEFNPVIVKELRGRMRGWRTAVVTTVYLVGVSGLMLLVYGGLYSSAAYRVNATVGKQLLFTIVGMQLLLLSIISPISTAGAISGEREKQTYDVLLTTQLSPLSIILGKLGAALAYALLLIIVTVPLQALALLLGGLSVEEVLLANIVLLMMTVLYGATGIACSSLFRTTLVANSVALGLVVSLTLMWPLFGSLLVATMGGQSSNSGDFQLLVMLGGSLNPIVALVLSDQLLPNSDSLLVTNFSNGSSNLSVLHPWLVFTLFALVTSGLLIWISTLALRPRGERMNNVESTVQDG